jgi:hypothetical protein
MYKNTTQIACAEAYFYHIDPDQTERLLKNNLKIRC